MTGSIEYCSVAPERLIGIAMISLYNVERAVAELERCRKLGLRGAIIWQCASEGVTPQVGTLLSFLGRSPGA